MVLGGREPGEAHGCVFLYRSQDLYNWEYRSVLSTYRVAPRKSIECANYFPLDGKYVLLVSPYTQVSFSIGDFVNDQHSAQDWYVFDHSLQYYATNTYQDDQGRTIVVGWIRANGMNGWAGCLSLPRVVRLEEDNSLRVEPIKELEVLRTAHRHTEYDLDSLSKQEEGDPFIGDCVEIQAQYDLQGDGVVGFKLIDDRQTHLISYDFHKNLFQAVDEIAELQFPQEQRLSLHIFIDRSVVEIFINGRETFSTTFYPDLADDQLLKIVPFFENGTGHACLDFWKMRSINLDRLNAI
jgi:beta-fructofuranosidase